VCVGALLLGGCPKAATVPPQPHVPATQPAATTQPAQTQPTTTAPVVKALPKQALTTFEGLTPKIVKPVNPADVKELPPRAATAVAEAEVAIARGEHMAAITRLERAVGFAPDNPRMLRALGMAYAGLLNRGKAQTNLRKAVLAAPDDLQVHILLGKLASAQKQNAAAIVSFRTALMCSEADDANPLVGETLLRLGDLLAVGGYHTAALACYERLSTNIEKHGRDYAARPAMRVLVLKSEQLLTRRGSLLLQLRKPKLAADLLARSRKRDRTSVATARLLLQALIAAKDVPAAESMFHELAAESNMKGIVGDLAGDLCTASGDKALALKLWRGQKARGQYDGALAVGLAAVAEKLGAGDDAMTILTELLAVVPDNMAAGRALVTLQARQGKGDVALRVLARLMAGDNTGQSGARAGLAELARAKLPDDFESTFAAGIKSDKPLEAASLYYAAGELARLRGKTDLAAELLDKALRAKKDFLPACEALADVYVAQRRFDKVDAMLAKLTDSSHDAYRVAVIRGKLNLARGAVRKAITEFEKARQLNASDAELLLLLGDAYWQVTDLQQELMRPDPNASNLRSALRAYTAARDAAPDDMRAMWRLFRVGVEPMGKRSVLLSQAESVVARLAAKGGSLDYDLMRAELALVGQKAIAAKGLIAKLQASHSADRRVRLLAIRLDVDSNWDGLNEAQRTALIRKARAIFVSDPGQIEATRLLVSALLKAKKTDEALSIWKLLQRKRPGDLRVAAAYSEELERAKKYAQAADMLAIVVAADPKNTHRLTRLIGLLQQAKRYPEAIAHAVNVLKTNPSADDRRSLRVRLLDLYEETKAFDKAQKILDDMILTTGDEDVLPILRQEKIRLYGLAKAVDQAEKYALGWIGQEPNVLAPRQSLIYALMEAKLTERAIKLVDEWLKAKASADADDVVVPWCRQIKVSLLMEAAKYAAALKQADAYIKITPDAYHLYGLKANCLTELGRRKDALVAMELGYEKAPDAEKATLGNDLAYMYSEHGVKLDKAERLARAAMTVRRRGDTRPPIAFMDTMAWVHYKKGEIDAAVRLFEQVFARDDLDEQDHPVIYDHAGDTYYRAGKPDRAVEFWTRAAESAKKETRVTSEVRNVRTGSPKKIEAVKAGKVPAIAPLGQGVKVEADNSADKPADKPVDKPAPDVADEPKIETH